MTFDLQKLMSDFTDTTDFDISGTVLEKYRGNSARVAVPNVVTEIGRDAFKDCAELIELTVPESVHSLGVGILSGCTALKRVSILGEPSVISLFDPFLFALEDPLFLIFAPKLPPTVFFRHFERKGAALCYLAEPESYDASVENSYRAYAAANRIALLNAAVEADRADMISVLLGCVEQKGPMPDAQRFEADYLQPAQEANAVSCIAVLLEWQRRHGLGGGSLDL